MERVRSWLTIATSSSVLRRSGVTCVLVGTILVAINHGESLLQGRIDPVTAVQIALTFLVPFVVSMTSSVAAIEGHGSNNGRHFSSFANGRGPICPVEHVADEK